MNPSSPKFLFRGVEVNDNDDVLSTMQLIVNSGTTMDAMEFIDDYATYLATFGHGDPYQVAKDNLGYLIGYLERDEAKEAYHFFEIGHPLLGDTPWELDAEDIFKKGMEWGEAMKKGLPYP